MLSLFVFRSIVRRKQMKKRLSVMLLILTLLFPSAFAETAQQDDLLLYLPFDEGQGASVQDASGHLNEANVQYQYLAPAYTDSMEPQWRKIGVSGGSLLFDGASTYVAYDAKELCVSGNALTISVWVAPRAFEWDDPNAASSGNAHVTAIVGQYYQPGNQGFLLGYQRFGRLCFQVGTEDDWFTLWAKDARLERNAWNHVAAVFDGEADAMSIYLNGERVAYSPVFDDSVIAPAVKESLLIGKNAYGEQIAAGNYQMFSGLMDELRLYDAALSDTEIAALADQAPGEIPYEAIGLENILTGDI